MDLKNLGDFKIFLGPHHSKDISLPPLTFQSVLVVNSSKDIALYSDSCLFSNIQCSRNSKGYVYECFLSSHSTLDISPRITLTNLENVPTEIIYSIYVSS